MKTTLLLLASLLSTSAAAWDTSRDQDDYNRNRGAQFNEIDLGNGYRNRNGYVNGEYYNSTQVDLGNGLSTESGFHGGRPVNCTTMDLGGGLSTTNCW